MSAGRCRASRAPPEGDHVARFGQAIRRGLISGDDLVAVLQALDAFTSATIVCDVPGRVS
ncbi:MAG: hypothetical protein WBF34_35875 [Streptosporangiaceae bacterium]